MREALYPSGEYWVTDPDFDMCVTFPLQPHPLDKQNYILLGSPDSISAHVASPLMKMSPSCDCCHTPIIKNTPLFILCCRSSAIVHSLRATSEHCFMSLEGYSQQRRLAAPEATGTNAATSPSRSVRWSVLSLVQRWAAEIIWLD